MTEPVNLNKARKARARADDTIRATENRIAFGRTKVEKLATKLDRLRSARALDGNKREP